VLTGKGEEFTPEEICAGREREGQRETRKINTCKAKG